jgi:hypothetical protein
VILKALYPDATASSISELNRLQKSQRWPSLGANSMRMNALRIPTGKPFAKRINSSE